MNHRSTSWCMAAALLVAGGVVGACGKSEGPAADPAPFRAAVAEYLERNNMGLAIKEIKAGPHVDGNAATMKASLTAAQLGGAAVTWEFRFEKAPDGKWRATAHTP